eukprot:scaffold11400_cov75-Skeletonema_dohrnii-CCMP3373.AAC.1
MTTVALSANLVEAWKSILGDTPRRLEVDFASFSPGEGPGVTVTTAVINGAIGTNIQEFCVKNKISKDAFVLGVFHRTLRAYSHEAFAIGVYQEGGNILLVPFEGKRNGGTESLQALNGRWTNDILPYTKTSYDEVKRMGYGCNVSLSVDSKGSPNKNVSPDSNIHLFVNWMECSSGDGSIEISFESGIGPWPGIEDRFQQIISQILTMQTSLSDPTPIDNILPQEKEQVLRLARGPQDPIINSCLHELVEKQARTRPDAIALLNKSGTEKMTYAELDAQAHRLAVELQRRGAKPNTYVGILMGEKTFEMHVAVLAVLKSGAAYVPMDAVLFPPERIKFIAEDTDMKLLVTVGEHVDLVEGGFEKILVEEAVKNTSHDDTQLQRLVKPTDCAYMIYTSGTTGTPKGVACHHIGPVNMMFYKSGVEVFSKGTPEEDVVGCAAPLIFDMFVYGYFGTLGSGLALSLDMKCCTMLLCTPSMADIFLRDKTNNIKMIFVGGEACIQGLESKVSTFVNCFGPTETSILCTAGNKSDTIGRPLPNTLCYVVHPDDGTLCPPGVSGELWVGGVGVSI